MLRIFGSLIKAMYSVSNIPINMKQNKLNPIKELMRPLRKASNSAFGEHYNFNEILKSDDIFNAFRNYVSIFDYNSMYKNWKKFYFIINISK